MTVMIAVAAAAAALRCCRRSFICWERSDAVLGAQVEVRRLPSARPSKGPHPKEPGQRLDHRQASIMADMLVKVKDGWWDNMAGMQLKW